MKSVLKRLPFAVLAAGLLLSNSASANNNENGNSNVLAVIAKAIGKELSTSIHSGGTKGDPVNTSKTSNRTSGGTKGDPVK